MELTNGSLVSAYWSTCAAEVSFFYDLGASVILIVILIKSFEFVKTLYTYY
jgi:hypothetical protein